MHGYDQVHGLARSHFMNNVTERVLILFLDTWLTFFAHSVAADGWSHSTAARGVRAALLQTIADPVP